MNILVLGGGGREHALVWKLAQSDRCKKIFCAPGNGGTATALKCSNVALGVMDAAALIEFATGNEIDLTVVGPDNPLAEGIVDQFEAAGLRIFGPRKNSARLEWSKVYAKDVMTQLKIPTAKFVIAENYTDAETAVSRNEWARVIKADGLALGKGVFVCDTESDAHSALKQIFDDKVFGDAGSKVVIEERLTGEESSLLVLCDGKKLQPLLPVRDFKRRFNEDKGPNTGGMGSIAPVNLSSHNLEQIETQILEPLGKALHDGQIYYRGVLYIGLMLVPTTNNKLGTNGAQTQDQFNPYVIEFNSRFGDPETQALLPLLKSDLLPLLWACTEGTLANQLSAETLEWLDGAACCVVVSTDSYPQAGSKGEEIDIGNLPPDAHLFVAGAVLDKEKLITNGGRILSVTATGPDLQHARQTVYKAVERIQFKDMAFRQDIGG